MSGHSDISRSVDSFVRGAALLALFASVVGCKGRSEHHEAPPAKPPLAERETSPEASASPPEPDNRRSKEECNALYAAIPGLYEAAARCQPGDPCKLIPMACPWGCEGAANANADLGTLEESVNKYRRGCMACTISCLETIGTPTAHCENGKCTLHANLLDDLSEAEIRKLRRAAAKRARPAERDR